MVTYAIGSMICLVILSTSNVNVFYVVSSYIIILSIVIRLHIVKKYAINARSDCMECVTSFFCTPCSIAQSKWRYWKDSIMNTHSLLFYMIAADFMRAHESHVTPARCKHRPTFLLHTALFPVISSLSLSHWPSYDLPSRLSFWHARVPFLSSSHHLSHFFSL